MSEIENLTEKEADQLIEKKLGEAQALLSQCEQIADKYGLSFRWEGPTYGTGASYSAKSPEADSGEEEWESSQSFGWMASSQSC